MNMQMTIRVSIFNSQSTVHVLVIGVIGKRGHDAVRQNSGPKCMHLPVSTFVA
jgi:hypothetical protein